jgi:hypothetical protein
MAERARMTEQQFADMAAACDRLLRAPGTSLARLAIPALHFLNEHPSALAQYAPVLTEDSDRRFFDVPRAFIRAVRGLTRSLTAPHLPAAEQGPIDVLIVSHLLKPQQLLQGDDFYFGALQSRLRDAGVSSLLLLIDHLRAAPIGGHIRPFPNARRVLPNTVSLTAEASIWRQCAEASRVLRREAAGARDSAGYRLAMLASRQALAASTLVNLRMHAVIAGLCEAVGPKAVITTYEGTVAERLIWHAARTAKRRPLCVGYQHATMLERAHAIRRPVAAPGLDCDPDVVLTLGEITHAALAASPGLRGVRLIRYGSHRRAALPVLPQPQHRPRRCLVLPDASDQECIALFDFALACARLLPDIGFALRPHPMVDIQSLLRRRPDLRKLPQNVQFSADGPLEREFAQARYCLYRGSSAALYAVRAGIKPYYLARPGELPIDCLFALAGWRETVTSPADLADRMSRLDPFTDSAAAGRAADVCERYVSPLRPAAIGELLAMAAR